MATRHPRLDGVHHRAFHALAQKGLAQYGLSKADLADQVSRRRSKADLLYENAGVQRSTADPLRGKSRLEVRRFVENTMSRPSSAEAARTVIWRIINAKKAYEWRKAVPGREDPWRREVFSLLDAGAPFVIEDLPGVEGAIRAFIHPKGVEALVRETLHDADAWIPKKARGAIERAIVRSITSRARDRADALAHWVAMSEGFIDVRVYEGPMHDPVTDAVVDTRQLLFRRIKLFDERTPLGPGERLPKAHERMKAIMQDTLDDSGQPTRLVSFVVPPMRATSIRVVDNGSIRISAEREDHE